MSVTDGANNQCWLLMTFMMVFYHTFHKMSLENAGWQSFATF